MRFDSFICSLDLGICEDQLQREAMFDLMLMFVMVDGVITTEEQAFMHDWLDSLEWTSQVDKTEYYNQCTNKCQHALDNDMVDDFISHRASLLVDPALKEQAVKLAHDVMHSDGELDDKERDAFELLAEKLKDKR